MLAHSDKPVVGPLHKAGGADSQKLSVATKFKVQYLVTSFEHELLFYALVNKDTVLEH